MEQRTAGAINYGTWPSRKRFLQWSSKLNGCWSRGAGHGWSAKEIPSYLTRPSFPGVGVGSLIVRAKRRRQGRAGRFTAGRRLNAEEPLLPLKRRVFDASRASIFDSTSERRTGKALPLHHPRSIAIRAEIGRKRGGEREESYARVEPPVLWPRLVSAYMPSQYPSDSQQEGRGSSETKMVSVANSPHVVRGKSAPTTREPGKETKAKVSGKTLQNGGVPHLILVKTPHPRPSNVVHRASPSSPPPPAPQNHHSPSSADDNAGRGEPAAVRTSIRTLAQPTGSEDAGATSCEEAREEGEQSVCPQVALLYTSGILTSRADRVLRRQLSLDDRLRRLHDRVRGRQGRGVCRHVQSQLSYAAIAAKEGEERKEEGEGRGLISRAASIPMQVDGAVEDIRVDRMSVARSLKFESCDTSDQSKRDTSPTTINDVVENSTKSVSDPLESKGSTYKNSLLAGSTDWSSLGQFLKNRSGEFDGSDGRSEVVERWRQQLRGACTGVGGGGGEICDPAAGGDVTDTSSDEEGDPVCFSGRKKRLRNVCRSWERSRGPIGAQWAWLRHRIAEINRQISYLDAAVQKRPKQEPFVLSPTTSARPLTNPTAFWGSGTERAKVVNGTNHASSIPHLLIPDGILNGPIQVKDLLSPSPLTGMSFILDDVGGYTSARTRALLKKPRRKIVRLRKRKRVCPNHTPKPVLPRDTPSWVWLDEGLQHVLRDHLYASMPQPKRRHRATVSSNRARVPSLSPSPGLAEVDVETPARIAGQKKSSLDVGPYSPSLSRSSTPVPTFTSATPSSSSSSTLTPSLPRKKRLMSHAPSYDIDNIVIPYSVAAATRLEKLEYKEVMTPGWREVESTPTDHAPSSTQNTNIEDLSDDHFKRRHDRFEAVEKKRFMNFISGSSRKRTRPSSLSSTPDPHSQNSSSSPWPPGKVRRATFPISPSDPPSRQVPVLAWPPRSFPLQGSDIEALTNPPPPPPLPLPAPPRTSSSPSPLLSRPLTPSLPATPSTSSILVTPLSSPSTPYGELPVSPAGEWAVNPQIVPATRPSATPSSIVLRLTKKT